MKFNPSSQPLENLIQHAIDSAMIDGWCLHGPYLVFTNGTARFYVRRHEAEGFFDSLVNAAPQFEPAAA